MRIGYGPISCQRHPDDSRTELEIYQEAIELAVEAEELGFDAVGFAEHHFVADGFLPSMLPMSAAIAARTERVTIGLNTVLAPFFDPLRIAEDAAVVDLISNGRLSIGLGQGWRPEEIEAYGLTKKELPARLIETVEVLRQAWSGASLEPPLAELPLIVRPQPARPGGPPIIFGSEAPVAIRRAGEIADGWQATMVDVELFAEQCGWIREGLAAAGRDPADFTFGLHHGTFPWKDGDAWELIKPHHHYFIWKSERMEREWNGEEHPRGIQLDELDEDFARSWIATGSPVEVVEQIKAFEAAAGQPIDYYARIYFPGLDPEIQKESMRIFAAEVMPALRAGA